MSAKAWRSQLPPKPLMRRWTYKEERLALLLAVVADVDAGLALLRHHPAQRGAAGVFDLRRIDRRAAGALGIEMRQRRRTRQAAGVGGQDAILAA